MICPRRTMRILSNPRFMLAAFLAFKIGQTTYAFLTGERPVLFTYVRLAEVIFLVPFACLAAKKRTPALYTVGLVLSLQIFPAFWAVVLIPFKHYILKTVTFWVSSYFAYGGYVFFQQAWNNLDAAKPATHGISGTIAAGSGLAMPQIQEPVGLRHESARS
jgi:hypothetical protein